MEKKIKGADIVQNLQNSAEAVAVMDVEGCQNAEMNLTGLEVWLKCRDVEASEQN